MYSDHDDRRDDLLPVAEFRPEDRLSQTVGTEMRVFRDGSSDKEPIRDDASHCDWGKCRDHVDAGEEKQCFHAFLMLRGDLWRRGYNGSDSGGRAEQPECSIRRDEPA